MPLATAKSFSLAFFPAWLLCYCLASVFHTQMVLLELLRLDVVIPLPLWLQTTFEDIFGLLPVYGSATAAALFIAFYLCGWLTGNFTRLRWLLPLAGGVAMLVLLMAMYPVMHVTLIAGARSAAGLALQCLAGCLGGLVFLRMSRPG